MAGGTRSRGRAAVLAAAVVVGSWPGSALAHTEVVETLPADGAVVAEQLEDLVLVFDHPVSFVALQVTDPTGAAVDTVVETGRTTQLAEPHREFQQVDGEWQEVVSDLGHVARALPAALPAAGEYTVDYQYTAEDGHNEQGSFAFAYDGPTGEVPEPAAWQDYRPEPTPGPTPVVAPPDGSPPAAAAAGDDARDADTRNADRGGAGAGAVVAGVATGSVLVAGVGALVLGRRRHAVRSPVGRSRSGRGDARGASPRLPTKRLF